MKTMLSILALLLTCPAFADTPVGAPGFPVEDVITVQGHPNSSPTNVTATTATVVRIANSSGAAIDPATEQTAVAISTTAEAIRQRALLLATEATLATKASESTSIAISTTAEAIRQRSLLLATEATLSSLNAKVTVVNTDAVKSASGTARVTAFPPFAVSYMASSSGTVQTGTAAGATQSIAYLFHPSTDTKRYEIDKIVASFGVTGNGGIATLRGAFITAENATPGGSVQPKTSNNRGNPSNGGTFRVGATGAPTRVVGDQITFLMNATRFDGTSQNNFVLYERTPLGEPLTLRASVAEGFEIRSIVQTALAGTIHVTVTYYWRGI